MADHFRVACRDCKKTFRVKRLEPGGMPACNHCGGGLVLLDRVRLACGKCGARTKPAKVSLAAPVACPRCGERLLGELPDAAVASNVPPQTGDSPQESQNAPPSNEGEDVTVQMTPSVLPGMGSEDMTVAMPRGSSVADGASSSAPETATQHDDDSLALQIDAPVGGLRKQMFGRYRIFEEIARGGMGIVYKAEDPELRRVVALKVLIAGEGATEESIKRFLREARAAGRLQHPNVVAVHEVGQLEGQHYFTMDFVDGRDLADLVETGLMPLDKSLEGLYDVCKALQAAHEKGIIHRDLKPQNILIDREGRALVTDFGLAKDLTSQSIQSMTGSVFGTPAYMSPEQAQGRTHEIDHRTDIYSMGVLLYEVATGEKPFGGETIFDTIEAVVNQDPRSPRELMPTIDPDLDTIILRCMEKDPARRYQTMRELAKDLGNYLDGMAIKARPIGPVEKFWRRVRRRKSTLIVGGAIPGVILAALLVYWVVAGDFLSDMQQEIQSGDAGRMASAVTMISGRLQDGAYAEAEQRERALAILRDTVGGAGVDAEKQALAVLVKEHDAAGLPVLVKEAQDTSLTALRRSAILGAVAKIAAAAVTVPERDALAGRIASILSNRDEAVIVREGAARALGGVWGKSASDTLLAVARDETTEREVRLLAIAAVGPHVRLGSEQMKAMLYLQGSDDEAIAAAAAHALRQSRGKTSIFAMYGIHGSVGKAFEGVGSIQEQNAANQRRLMELADGIFDDKPKPSKQEKPVEVMARRLTDADEEKRLAAAYDLGVLADPDALPHLVKALSDSSQSVRRSAARSIVAIKAVEPNASLDVRAIRNDLEAEDSLIRANAAWLLGRLEEAEAVPDLVRALEAESSDYARRSMVNALARIGDTGGLAAIRTVFDVRAGADPVFAVACLEAMRRFGRASVPHLIHALGAKSKRVRESAAGQLREVTGEDFGVDAEKWRSWLEGEG